MDTQPSSRVVDLLGLVTRYGKRTPETAFSTETVGLEPPTGERWELRGLPMGLVESSSATTEDLNHFFNLHPMFAHFRAFEALVSLFFSHTHSETPL